jgi:hypothetical protein
MTTPRKLHNIPISIPRHSALPGLVVAWKPYHFWPSRQYAESMARPYPARLWKVRDCGGMSQISPSKYPSRRRSTPPQPAACGAPAVVATPLGGRRCSLGGHEPRLATETPNLGAAGSIPAPPANSFSSVLS